MGVLVVLVVVLVLVVVPVVLLVGVLVAVAATAAGGKSCAGRSRCFSSRLRSFDPQRDERSGAFFLTVPHCFIAVPAYSRRTSK